MENKDKKIELAFRYVRLAIEARRSNKKIPTDEMKNIENELGLVPKKIMEITLAILRKGHYK